MSTLEATAAEGIQEKRVEVPEKKARIASIDAFRGFTVLSMIFVIQVAGYTDLPFTQSWFGSPPVSQFHHAGDAVGNTLGVGLTFTDLVAPFFVFIVGMVLPLSKRKRGGEFWKHVGTRTFLLIALGVLYISLILNLSYWWGILQAIGVAYFMGATLMRMEAKWRWAVVALIAVFHQVMSLNFSWWLTLGDATKPFLTITNPTGDPLRPLTVHCTPWASISYGLITVIGTFLGEAVLTRDPKKIIRQSLIMGSVLCLIGYILHLYQWPVFAMNKPNVSVSYAIFTSGVASFTFLIFYLVMDMWKIQKWAWPFMVFGSNALLGYFLQPIVRIFLFALGFKPFFSGHTGWDGVLFGLIWTAIIWVVLLWCNKRNIYWKI
ncbi:MAG: heparan-alpha-glucosaminide N-acetyltransferase domain-containing protein [Acidobacteriota bacterium]